MEIALWTLSAGNDPANSSTFTIREQQKLWKRKTKSTAVLPAAPAGTIATTGGKRPPRTPEGIFPAGSKGTSPEFLLETIT
ncbi:MAG: hypothetical protein N3E46_14755 [Gemmataceae bacterium]|jgi:hypothetical protein|nr:hypothetical protein [Gemmataceae bacterium]